MSNEMTPREQGRLAAERLDGSAIECPYLPDTQQRQRSEWLEGFSEGRPASSPASDPAHADDPMLGHPNGAPMQGYKEG